MVTTATCRTLIWTALQQCPPFSLEECASCNEITPIVKKNLPCNYNSHHPPNIFWMLHDSNLVRTCVRNIYNRDFAIGTEENNPKLQVHQDIASNMFIEACITSC